MFGRDIKIDYGTWVLFDSDKRKSLLGIKGLTAL